MVTNVKGLTIKIFADGADLTSILEMRKNPLIAGFTTNPTLMRKAGICNYSTFARILLDHVEDRPISFEVFADDFPTMIKQGQTLASWGRNVNVKIPVVNTEGEFTGPVIQALASEGVAVNVTAVMTCDQVSMIADTLNPIVPAIVSVFAGRIADTGTDPMPIMAKCKKELSTYKNIELLWASTRELLNIFQANKVGCHIITCTNDIIKKLELVGKDLKDYSLETSQMFYRDAVAAGFELPC